MVVVTIIGILAVVSGTAYRKYADKARASEVFSVFGDIRSKEEAYRAEFSIYCNTAATCSTAATETGSYYPALLTSNEPRAKPISSTSAPAGWTTLGISPGKSSLYCGYVAIAGLPSNFTSNAGTNGQALWSASTPAAPTGVWWYMMATCDNDGKSAVNTIYVSGMNTTAVVVQNEGT